MTTTFSLAIAAVLLFLLAACPLPPPPSAHALGGTAAATLAVVYGSSTAVCTIVAEQPVHRVQCWRDGHLLPPILPTVSFDAVAGGRDTLCGVVSGGSTLLCWNASFDPKRIYTDASSPLTSVAIGDTQICALRNLTAVCWRGSSNVVSSAQLRSISSGLGFSCGILESSNRVFCWGDGDGADDVPGSIQSAFANCSMKSIQVGGSFACGIDTAGFVICKGDNSNGQLNIPANDSAYEYRVLALGANHSCAIRESNGTVICWGGNGEFSLFSGNNEDVSNNITDAISFETIVAGLDFTCGLITTDFSVICWGPGWPHRWYYTSGITLPLRKSLPGPCVDSVCECNLYPQSQTLCSGNGHICRPCDDVILTTTSPTNSTSFTPSTTLKKGLLAFGLVGSIGGLGGICTVAYLLMVGVCFGKKKIHNSVQPTMAATGQQSNSSPMSRSSTLRRQGSMLMRRQRSGTSSIRHPERAEEFSFSYLSAATDGFSLENKIGSGSFGVVYKGKLPDGQEVAIKRSENGPKAKKFQEKESAFDSELAFLSRLHHKHLVRLVGYCEERDERLLVYEYMKNGAIHDHLHDRGNTGKSSSFLNSWKMRIKISLDAARGIEYLHNYAVPPIIHRDIKSSNILLDECWTARVSDFGLSLMGPGDDRDYKPTKAAGTVGYIDPEYYGLNVLTAKSDVYGFGVVLLELLTGKRAIFRTGEDGEGPISIVDYAVPVIMAGDLVRVLDPRVASPRMEESEAVELVGYTAMHCVHLEGKDRPTMSDIVANLERALCLCDESRCSISSGSISD